MITSASWGVLLIAAALSMVVGSLWYSQKLFGKAWMKHAGVGNMGKYGGMGKTMLMAFIGNIVTAYVLSYFIGAPGIASVGAAVGFWAWLGFVAPVNFGVVLWEKKPMEYFWINTGHSLVSLMVMGVVIAAWS